MNSPLLFSFAYLLLGMTTTVVLWSQMAMEIEMAIGMEEDEFQPLLRVFLTVVFVLAWPLVLADVIRKG